MSDYISPKLSIEDKDKTDEYRPVSLDKFFQMVEDQTDRVIVTVPNMCGGETRITIFKESERRQ